MQQHAKAIHCGIAPLGSRLQQIRLQRRVDRIRHQRRAGQGSKIDFQRRFAGHAQRRGVDEDGGLSKHCPQLVPPVSHNSGAEMIREDPGFFLGSVDNMDFREATRQQRPDDRTGRAARAQNHGRAAGLVPARGPLVEIAQKAEPVGVGAHQAAVFQPERVDGAHGLGSRVQPIAKPGHQLLVRHGDIGAGEASGGNIPVEGFGPLRLDAHPDIFPLKPVLLQPVAVNEGRAGMGDGPAGDGGAADGSHGWISPFSRRNPRRGSSGSPRMVK